MTFTHALVRRPAETVAEGETTRLGNPNVELTLHQYENYLHALEACGLQVTVLPPNPDFPDGHYVEDVAVIYEELLVVCAPGAASRRHEPQSVIQHLPQQHKAYLTEGATLEGGDVLVCADKKVLIGLSDRTNLAGAEQLKAALQNYDSAVQVHFIPVEGVLHLKTGLTELAPGILLHDPAMNADFDIPFAEVITLPAEQGYSANVLPMNDKLLIPAGYPIVHQLALDYYGAENFIALEMSEFMKMDGSLTCLSLRYRL